MLPERVLAWLDPVSQSPPDHLRALPCPCPALKGHLGPRFLEGRARPTPFPDFDPLLFPGN